MYFMIVLLLKAVVKRQTGGIGPTDILVIVLIAEIAGPGFTADYASVVEGIVLAATVLFWSFTIEWLTHRSPAFARHFQPAPLLLVKDGRMLLHNMRTELITRDELMTHLREEGVSAVAEVEQACMEPDGMISVIKKLPIGLTRSEPSPDRTADFVRRLAPASRNDDMGRMYDFKIDTADKPETWRQVAAAAEALTEGEPDAVANMANVAALLWESLPELNWAGFYRNVAGELVLGPFQGRAACIRIPFGKGVCGAAAASLQPQLVEDVDAFPGHIACDSASRSELVVPLVHEGKLIGVIDLDSPRIGRFDGEDLKGCLELARLLGPRLGIGSKADRQALKKS